MVKAKERRRRRRGEKGGRSEAEGDWKSEWRPIKRARNARAILVFAAARFEREKGEEEKKE